jgi:hypothetical protein
MCISAPVYGSWNVRSAEVRYGILTSSGYHPKVITTLNQTQFAKKGYMQSPNDWKNVEMTGYFKVNHFTVLIMVRTETILTYLTFL